MTTAFVAGATGYTGRALVESLRRRDIHTIAHVRPDSPLVDIWRERFSRVGAVVSTAAFDEASLVDALAGVSHLFVTIGTTKKRARAVGQSAAESYEAVDHGLTALLVRAAARARGEVRVIYLSSLGADPRSRNAYLRARGRAEEAVRAGGMPWTIVRASFISGPDRVEPRPLERIGAKASDALLHVAGLVGLSSVRDRFHSVDAHHLAEALLRLAFDPAAERHLFEPPFTRPVA